jgi:hypothetical protein
MESINRRISIQVSLGINSRPIQKITKRQRQADFEFKVSSCKS